jgi:2-methylisocitrate lyase-like PEP mutase family enzyme
MKERKALRAMLETGDVILCPMVFSPLTALIAQSTGFKAVAMGGHIIGDHLALSEPLTTMTEMVAQVASIVKAINIPVIVDAGAGYGDPVNMLRCVKEFEFAGAAALHIEDQVYPKRLHYHQGVEHVIPLEDFLLKLRVAVEARTDPDFVIIARTDAKRAVEGGSLDEVIRRCKAFVEAGADAIQPSRLTLEELKILRREMPNVPISAGKSVKMAKQAGTQIVVPSSLAPLLVAMRAVMDYYQKFIDTGEGEETDLPPETRELRSRFMEIIGLPKYWEIEAASTEKGAQKTQHADADPSFYRKSR